MRIRTDKTFLVLTGVSVAGLALVAGAISFSHMTELASVHGQTGWKAYAFPVSVDGLELVASLYILAQRRIGRRPGLLPWAALLVGTAASLAANVAVGGHDPVGRALAGWPAVSLLVSIKLLFSMFDHDEEGRPVVRDDQGTDADRPSVPGSVPGTGPTNGGPSGTVPASSGTVPGSVADSLASSAGDADGRPGAQGAVPAPGPASGAVPIDIHAVADLLPAARAARAAITANGRA
ncbi:MAG TPA: DUF2637 domain-containing protein, partial [Micromonosporaceae bacterium]|nr:DUF2637 domain-containing protein [Micromonosporaceae bacterium]